MLEEKEVQNQSLEVIKKIEGLTVTNQKEYDSSGAWLIKIKEMQSNIKSIFKPIVDKAHQAHKEAINKMNEFLNPLETAESKLKAIRMEYYKIKELEQRKEQERLDEIQRKEREKLERRAEKAAEKGNDEKAEALKQQAKEVETISPIVPVKVTKTVGIQMKKILKFRVINEDLLSRAYLTPNMAKISEEVKRTKGTVAIPGVEIYYDTIEAV